MSDKVCVLNTKPLTLQRMERLYVRYGEEMTPQRARHVAELYEKYQYKLSERLILLAIESNLKRLS